MSKVICDVCGTTYPETASQCPICGCAKNSAAQTAAGAAGGEAGASYTHVRGGRFSKSNVRRRNESGRTPQRRASSGQAPSRARNQSAKNREENNKPLVITIVLLLIAIMLVIAYLIISYFLPEAGDNSTGSGQHSQTSCTAIKLSEEKLEFTGLDCQWLLEVTKTPSNTTDTVTFTSEDTSVATVSPEGQVVPVANGETFITVKCGNAVAKCKVVCNISDDVTPPTEAPTPSQPESNIDPNFEFKFNTPYKDSQGNYDVTLNKQTWRAYPSNMTVDPSDITWISDNPEICVVDNGIVTITGKGKGYIHAEYNGKRVTCVVRVTVEPTNQTTSPYKLSTEDVTLYLVTGKDAFTLTLTNTLGINQNVTWQVSDEGYVKIEGNRVTALKSTSDLGNKYVSVYCEYEGAKFTCKVRIHEAT